MPKKKQVVNIIYQELPNFCKKYLPPQDAQPTSDIHSPQLKQ